MTPKKNITRKYHRIVELPVIWFRFRNVASPRLPATESVTPGVDVKVTRTTKWVWIYGINTVNVTESKTGTSWDIDKQQMRYHVVGCSQSDGFHTRSVAMSVGGYPTKNSNIFLKHPTREMLARFQLKDGFSIYPLVKVYKKRWKIHRLLMGSHQLFRLGHFLCRKPLSLPEGITSCNEKQR